jgi:hypothetical protein
MGKKKKEKTKKKKRKAVTDTHAMHTTPTPCTQHTDVFFF